MINKNFYDLRCVSLLRLVVKPNTPKVVMPRVLQADSRWWFLGFVLFLSFFSLIPFSTCCPASTWYQSKLWFPRFLVKPNHSWSYSPTKPPSLNPLAAAADTSSSICCKCRRHPSILNLWSSCGTKPPQPLICTGNPQYPNSLFVSTPQQKPINASK